MNQTQKRLVIIVDYAEPDFNPDLSDVAIETEIRLKAAFGVELDATVFDDDKAAIEYLESLSASAGALAPRGPNGYHDYTNEPIGGGNPYYQCSHCKRSDPEINGRLEGHEPWCPYRLAHENGEQYRPS
jgi:hypothetical protein